MNKLVSLVALAALIGGPAAAADLPTRKAPLAPAPYASPAYSWTGFYIGINGGYDFSRPRHDADDGLARFRRPDRAGVRAGLAGHQRRRLPRRRHGRLQYAVRHVRGRPRTDIDWVGQRKSASFTGAVLPPPFPATTLTTSASRSLDYLGTFRGRVGITPFDRGLLYVTGGLAYGGVRTSGSVVADQAPTLAWNGSTDQTRVGWTLGGGGEYAFTNNITFKAEALYYDLGTTNTTATGNANVLGNALLNGANPVFYTSSTRTSGVIARGGINFKF